MTYMELLEALQAMTTEDLAQNVTVYVRRVDEFYPTESMNTVNTVIVGVSPVETDVLDAGHKYLVI